MCWVECARALWKLSTGREPLRWLPLSFSSAIVCTAVAQALAQQHQGPPSSIQPVTADS